MKKGSANKKRLVVYFVASMVGKEKFHEQYKKIAGDFRELGCEVIDDINKVKPEEAWERTPAQTKKYFAEVIKKIKSSDIMVAEDSHPSSAVGYEIGYAVGNNKPTLILRHESISGLGAPFKGNPSKLLTAVKYNDMTLKKKLIQFLRKAEKGVFVKRLPIEFTDLQVKYVEYRQRRDGKKKSFNATVREIIDAASDADESFSMD